MTTYAVNLPQTNFPMKANLPQREPKMLEFWQSINLYQSFVSSKNSRGKFILHDGPPYANGDIHIGHAFNKTVKDIINKSKLLEGYSVPYVPGWDCHGLPIEINVEKKIGKAGVKVSVADFIAECRKYAGTQIELQKAGFKRLGVIGDWEHPYRTMDFKFEADIVRSLMKIVDAGYLVRGYKPVHWCIACGSALAEAEVEYKDKVSPSIDVSFRVTHPEKFNVDRLSIPVWTTTPWTLPANEAVALHPKIKYVLVKCSTLNEHLIIAEDLLVQVMQRYGEKNHQVVKTYLGSELDGLKLKHPFLDDKEVPVVLGEHVTVDTGTGAVHTAPAYGPDDYKLGLSYNLSINNPVDTDGKFLGSTKFFAGLDVFAANPKVIEVLKEHGNLIHEESLQHSYPHCWRHKTPLIFRATKQWFIGMEVASKHESLRKQALDAIKGVKWLPEQGQNSIQSMVEFRPDWCISRQRAWGIPITLFVHKESGKIHPEMSNFVAKIIAPGIEKNGLIYWHQVDANKFLQEHAASDFDAKDYEKVTDSLDVWFNSGVTHSCVLKERPELSFPADVYVEGNDQYRGWFQSSLLSSLALSGEVPYKTVITHGFCVDAKGHKMSKSLGNVVEPKKVIDKYGADILRLWAGATYLHDDIAASDEIFARTIDIYRTLRNTARFLLGNLFDFNPAQDLVAPDKMLAVDRYAVAQVLGLVKTCRDHYASYQFHVACAHLQVLITNDISGFYFSVIKDRLYTMAPRSVGRRSAQTALFYILELLVRLIAPILSFTAEEIWQEMGAMDKNHGITSRVQSIFMARWDDFLLEQDFDLGRDIVSNHDWEEIKNYRTEVNKELEKLRISKVIGSSLEAEVVLYGDDQVYARLAKLQDDLRFLLITSQAALGKIAAAPSDAITTGISGLKLIAKRSPHKKCSRCWHYREDVGSSADHPELCGRCVENLFGDGEKRLLV